MKQYLRPVKVQVGWSIGFLEFVSSVASMINNRLIEPNLWLMCDKHSWSGLQFRRLWRTSVSVGSCQCRSGTVKAVAPMPIWLAQSLKYRFYNAASSFLLSSRFHTKRSRLVCSIFTVRRNLLVCPSFTQFHVQLLLLFSPRHSSSRCPHQFSFSSLRPLRFLSSQRQHLMQLVVGKMATRV